MENSNSLYFNYLQKGLHRLFFRFLQVLKNKMIRKPIYIAIIYSIFIFLIGTIEMQSQWEKINDVQEGYVDNYWLDVFFLPENPRFGWICGYNGKVIRSTDGGDSWRGTTISGIDQLESIHFVNELVGYTSGSGGIYKSSDGGQSWKNVSPKESNMLWGCYFLDENNGGVIGGGCYEERQHFYRTSDGGATWHLFLGNEKNSGLTDLILYEDGSGFASSSGRIWKTNDSGYSWEIFSRSGENDWQEEITHYNKSFLVPFSTGCSGSGTSGGMRFTSDNGKSWREYSTGKPMFGTFLLDSLRGWACGWDSNVLFTVDGGRTWVNKNCGIEKNNNLDDIWFINDTLGFVVGRGVYRTAEIQKLNPEILAWGSNHLCEGDSVMLYPEKDYKYYNWSNGSTSRYIWVSKPGKYHLIVSNSECDSTASNVIEVFLNPKPQPNIISSEGSYICQGDSALLSSSQNYLSYLWSSGDSTKSISAKEEGLYKLLVVDSNGCQGDAEFFLKVFPNPKPKILDLEDSVICDDNYLLLKTEQEYNNYKWFDEDGNELETEGNYAKITKRGLYKVIVVDSNGCRGESSYYNADIRKDSNRLVINYLAGKELFIIDTTNIIRLNCDSLEIYNKGPTRQTINDLYLFDGTVFSIPLSQFPLEIEPYSSKKIEICVSPNKLGINRDTILCPDLCSNHIIPLETFCIPNIYFGETECGIRTRLETSSLYSNGFITSQPYPNPATVYAQIDFVGQKESKAELKLNSELFDIFGNKRLEGTLNYEEISLKENKSFVFGKILFNLNGIENGLFIVKINDEQSFNIFQLIINK